MSKKEQTKQLILTTAWLLFKENGYQNTSTRDIAMASGVANGTVFSHFKSKIDILKAGFSDQLDEVLLNASKKDKSHTAIERMSHYAKALYPFYLSQREFSRELLGTIMWQHSELAPQLARFKNQLIHDNNANAHHADVIIDLYFMTLLYGLNHPEINENELVAQLENKLSLLNVPN